MLRRTLDTSLIVVALLSVGCTLVTDFEKTRSEAKGGAGGGVDTGGRSSSGGTESKATYGGGSGTGSGGTTLSIAGSTGTGTPSGAAAGTGTLTVTEQGGSPNVGGSTGATSIGSAGATVGGTAASGGATMGTAGMTVRGGTTGIGGDQSSSGGVTASGGNSSIGGLGAAGAGAAQGGVTGSGTTSVPTICTISTTPYVVDYGNPDNNCQSCQPSVSASQWSPRPDGTGCGTSKICRAGTCITVCTIAGLAYDNGTVNPDNPCQTCDTARALGNWSDTPTSRCVSAVSAGYNSSCAIASGKVYCWGDNNRGQLGLGTATGSSLVPVLVPGLSNVTKLEVGDFESCALTGNDLYCWGRAFDEDADGYIDYHPSPSLAPSLPVGPKSGFASGGTATCVIVNGEVYCWGMNLHYILGADPAVVATSLVPMKIPSISGATAVTMDANHACALTGTGAFCWGSNEHGELGDGTPFSHSAPVQASVFGNISAIETAGDADAHTCAIDRGFVDCVGSGGYGELGDGNSSTSFTAVTAKGLASATRIAAGGNSTCALTGGNAYCWGLNDLGQLGTGGTQNALIPTMVLGLPPSSVVAISLGSIHACAVASGNAYCWGNNARGMLGNNSTTQSLAAVKVQIP